MIDTNLNPQRVQLLSGGPVMTFSHYVPPTERGAWDISWPTPSGALCIWLDAEGHKQSEWFNPSVLVAVE